MAFLDNSGDIILDAVLTDAGRQRMARGEFKIVKFAFGDEEINYELFNSNHPSGSAFSDLQIMQTPILEAFTNNTSLMKTKLITINRNNILYMPIFKLNGQIETASKLHTTNNGIFLLADETTATTNNGDLEDGFHYGTTGGNAGQLDSEKRYIAVDQGLETAGNPPITSNMPDDLIETAFLVRMDHRLLRLYGYDSIDGGETGRYAAKTNSFVDDDAIATYYISGQSDSILGPRQGSTRAAFNTDNQTNIDQSKNKEVFNGPLGPRLRIAPKTSIQVQQSTALFDELGSSGSDLTVRGATITDYKFIDTLVNVVGVTSGYSIDIPVRIIKKV